MNPHRAVCFLTRFALTGRCQGVMVKNNTTAPPAWGDAVKNLNQGQWYPDRNAGRWIYTDLNVLLQQLKYDSVPAGNICMSEAITSAFRATHLQSINLFISLWIAVSGYFFLQSGQKTNALHSSLSRLSLCSHFGFQWSYYSVSDLWVQCHWIWPSTYQTKGYFKSDRDFVMYFVNHLVYSCFYCIEKCFRF